MQAAYVNNVIPAEISSPQNQTLCDVILKHNLHQPCRELNPSSVCMKEEHCSKRFPKAFVEEAGHDEVNFYVTYRPLHLSDGGATASWKYRTTDGTEVLGTVDNFWVVLYCPALSNMFQFDFNAELCISRVDGIKCLFEYICEGPCIVNVQVFGGHRRYNENPAFQEARYVSAAEAVWRLLQVDIVEVHPTAVRLDVHLENHRTVYSRENNEQSAVKRGKPGTKLTKSFNANGKWPKASHIKYSDPPQYSTWNAPKREWIPRAKLKISELSSNQVGDQQTQTKYNFGGHVERIVGRIFSVSPREDERFFLRVLLQHKTGARFSNDLETHEGTVCATYWDTCARPGLRSEDDDWRKGIRDSFMSSFVPLSHVFATIIGHCYPTDPAQLFIDCCRMLFEDIRSRFRRQKELDIEGEATK